MIEALITWTVIVLVIIGIRFLIRKNKGYRRKYALGLTIAEQIENFIKNKDYEAAERNIKNQSLNDITQIIDHLSLSLKEIELVQWEESQKTDFSKLTLGVFYLHLAWITRSHKLAKNVSNKKAEAFFDYLLLCEETFDTIGKESYFFPELQSRKIRLYMSLGDKNSAVECFQELCKSHPDFLWPYIHYSELIQPKWGGKIENIEKFYESLPNSFLIHSIVELKLILDAIIINDNYFKKYSNDLYGYARDKVVEIDAEYSKIQIISIHRYILYNYMEAIAEVVKLKSLQKKYEKLKDGQNTIYPHGLLA